MKRRKLGKSGLEVSALGLGCMRMSFGAVDIQLSANDLQEIDEAMSYITVVGDRY